MKHPPFEVLQDYFENAVTSTLEARVKAHLHQCDQCTHVLAQFTTIETRVKNQAQVEVSANTTKRILNSAHELLAQKRAKKEKLGAFVQEWKEVIYPQIKLPALQFGSLAMVLVVIIAVEKSQGGHEEMFEPLSDSVHEITYSEDI